MRTTRADRCARRAAGLGYRLDAMVSGRLRSYCLKSSACGHPVKYERTLADVERWLDSAPPADQVPCGGCKFAQWIDDTTAALRLARDADDRYEVFLAASRRLP